MSSACIDADGTDSLIIWLLKIDKVLDLHVLFLFLHQYIRLALKLLV